MPALELKEFRDTFLKSSSDYGVNPPNEEKIREYFDDYKEIVEFLGGDGKLEFEKDGSDKITFFVEPRI